MGNEERGQRQQERRQEQDQQEAQAAVRRASTVSCSLPDTPSSRSTYKHTSYKL